MEQNSPPTDGLALLDLAAEDHSLDTLLMRCPPLQEKARRAMIQHLRDNRETWEPKQ